MYRKFGWVKDAEDTRDFLYEAKFATLTDITLPLLVDYRDKCSPIEDQGSLGSCTAQSVVGDIEYLDKKDDGEYTDYSRLFLYYNTRLLQGTLLMDSGATLRNTIKSAARFGVCKEIGMFGWEYDIKRFREKPWFWCYWNARSVVIKEYLRISHNLTAMKHSLALGYPFVFGFTVFESFMDDPVVANTGKMSMPRKNDKSLGGHAVCAVGYDDEHERFIIRNSWGEKWGENGYFYMPYEFIANKEYCDDFWAIMRY